MMKNILVIAGSSGYFGLAVKTLKSKMSFHELLKFPMLEVIFFILLLYYYYLSWTSST